jgi:hypothetical protein
MTHVSTFIHSHSQTMSEKPDSALTSGLCSRGMINWPLSHTFKLSWSKHRLQIGVFRLLRSCMSVCLSSYSTLSLVRLSFKNFWNKILWHKPRDRHGTADVMFRFCSTASYFFVCRANQTLIFCVGVLSPGCVSLYYIVYAQLFLKPRLLTSQRTLGTLLSAASL